MKGRVHGINESESIGDDGEIIIQVCRVNWG